MKLEGVLIFHCSFRRVSEMAVGVVVLSNGDLFKVRNPSGSHDFSSFGNLFVVAGLRHRLDPSLGLDFPGVVTDPMEDWTLWMDIMEGVVHFRCLSEVSFRLEVVFKLIDHWSGRTKVTVIGLCFRGFLKATFWFQVVLQGSHNVRPSCWFWLVLSLGFCFVWQWSLGKSQAGGSSEVGAGFAAVAEKFHLWSSFSCSVVSQKGCRSGDVGSFVGADASKGGGASVLRHFVLLGLNLERNLLNQK